MMPSKLSEFLVDYHPLKVKNVVGNTDALTQAVDKLQRDHGIGEERIHPSELKDKLIEFERRYQRRNWQKYPWHEASGLFRIFFTSEQLSENRWDSVTKILLKTLKETDRELFCRAAMDAYWQTYGKNQPWLTELKKILQSKPREHFPGLDQLFQSVYLFDSDKGHLQLAAQLATAADPYSELQRLGVRSPHSEGFFVAVFKAILVELDSELKRYDAGTFEKVKRWLRPEGGNRAEIGKENGIDALVLPFEVGGPTELRDDIGRFLIDTYGDPRVHQKNWSGVSEKSLEIVNRWLTTKSLKVFFDIIDKFEGSHMWEPRRQFWMQMDREDLIDDAWVVLNCEGRRIAQGLAEQHDDPTFKSHGFINDSDQTCYFIMKIGNLTVVEGTHSFRVRFFHDNQEEKPSLARQEYEGWQLRVSPRNCAESFVHDVHDKWQRKTRKYIRRNR